MTAGDVDVVLELIGGIEPARTLVLRAMEAGKSVVTANKALLAEHGPELFDEAVRRGVDLLYEAAVGGGIPVIRSIREHLAGDRVDAADGDPERDDQLHPDPDDRGRVDAGGRGARGAGAGLRRGRPERGRRRPRRRGEGGDPGDDRVRHVGPRVGGVPAGHRAACRPTTSRSPRRLGYVVKLLAVAERVGDAVSVRVQPAMLPTAHPLASVRESFNAVLIEGERVGPLMLYGRGAGGDPTATSVVGDLIELARGRGVGRVDHQRRPRRARRGRRTPRACVPIDDVEGEHYLLLEVADRPGVLAAIAHAFAHHQVSIRQVWQEGHGDEAMLVIITHRAVERTFRECVRTLEALGSVKDVRSVIRVEAWEG